MKIESFCAARAIRLASIAIFTSLVTSAAVDAQSPPSAGIRIPSNRPNTSTPQTTSMTPYLAEEPNMTSIDPCGNFTPEDIHLSQGPHDGVSFRFDGANAAYNALFDIYYVDKAGSTYTCQKNSNVSETATNPTLVYDFGWGRSSAGHGDMTGRLNWADAYMHGVEASGQAGNACYICGLARFNHGCFPPGVRVATDGSGGSKLVEDVAVGDMLWNPLLGRSAKVLKVIEGPETLPLISFGFGSTTLTVSQKHPVLTDSGVKMAKDLNLTDRVFAADGSLNTLSFVSQAPAAAGQYVINFILEANSDSENERMVLADGIVTGDLTIQRALAKLVE